MTEPAQEWFDAIRKGELPVVERLLAADPALLMARDANGISSVLWSCYVRQPAIRDRLLTAGPELDLFEAVAAGADATALALLAADATRALDWASDGFTPLHLAAFFSRTIMAARLLELGADPGAPARNPTRVAPLHSAAAAGATEIARMLLERGADPDARQAQGFTALIAAAQLGNDALAELLLAHGAQADARCDDGRAAADFAQEKSHHALADRLRHAGG